MVVAVAQNNFHRSANGLQLFFTTTRSTWNLENAWLSSAAAHISRCVGDGPKTAYGFWHPHPDGCASSRGWISLKIDRISFSNVSKRSGATFRGSVALLVLTEQLVQNKYTIFCGSLERE